MTNNKTFGYIYTKDHKHLINEKEAEQLVTFFVAYVSGMTLDGAVEVAGIKRNHQGAYWLLQNRKYIGERPGFPAIIDKDLFERAQIARNKRMGEPLRMPHSLYMDEVKEYHGDPFEQAEYLYTLIKGHY
jgi:hypothetical protein